MSNTTQAGECMDVRNSMFSDVELSENLCLSLATLAKWRSAKKGPSYIKIGRRIFYPKMAVSKWLQDQTMEIETHEHQESRREVALPISVRRERVRSQHRLGRHRVKRETSPADRGRGTEGATGGTAAAAQDQSHSVH